MGADIWPQGWGPLGSGGRRGKFKTLFLSKGHKPQVPAQARSDHVGMPIQWHPSIDF